jgi:uncharacterized repeat protein (TIGR01451 family)/CSLREA domain-containing protein
MKHKPMLGIALALFLAASLLAPTPARAAATITVNTTGDVIDGGDGLCSLREAVIAANTDTASGDGPGECQAGSGADTIEFDPALPLPATFVLTITGPGEDSSLTGDLDILGTVAIVGVGAGNTLIDGDGADRILEIRPAAHVTLSGVTLQHGDPGPGLEGGGILVDLTGRLTLNEGAVMNNTAAAGGGAMVLGLLTLTNTTVENNQGGGIRNDGGLLLFTDVDVLNNTGGYGIYNENGATLSYTGGTVSGNQGGGIYNTLSRADLSTLTIANNTGGGGVHNSGLSTTQLTLSHSTIVGNAATSGGGILNEGLGAVASIDHTSISLNSAAAAGGGINNTGSLTADASTLDQNQATAGGAIDHSGASLYLTNVTLSSNSVTDNGGGLHNRSSAVLASVTFTGISSGTGANIYNDGDTAALIIRNSIVANPQGGLNCVNNIGTITSHGYNLESSDTCEFTAPGDITNTDPLLGPLQDNGGATLTHALLQGSPAIDAANPAPPGSGGDACPALDQRGVARPQGATCDVGSYERILGAEADLSVVKVDAVDPVIVGDDVIYTATVGNAGPDGAQNVVLSDPLPGGVIYVSATPDQGTCDQAGGLVTCSLGSIASGGSADVVIVVTTTAPGILTNTATVSSDTADPDPADNSATAITSVNTTYSVFLYLPLLVR